MTDPSQEVARLFIDGVLVAVDSADPLFVTAGSFVIGPGSSGLGVALSIDEVAFYRYALSDEEVARNFAGRVSNGLSGSGAVVYAIDENPTIHMRNGAFTIAGVTVPVTQTGVECLSVSPPSAALGAMGGSGAIQVTALDSSCAWTATVSQSWVTLQGTPGSGTGEITYTVASNATPFIRTAAVTVAGHSVTLSRRRGASAPGGTLQRGHGQTARACAEGRRHCLELG